MYLKQKKKTNLLMHLDYYFFKKACEWNLARVLLILCSPPNREFDLKCYIYIYIKKRHGLLLLLFYCIFLPWVNFSLSYDILWKM